MRAFRNLSVAISLVLGMAGAVRGDVITYTSTISQTLPYTITGTSNTTTAAILPKFSSSLGTLNSVSFQQSNFVTIDALSQVDAGEFINGVNITGWTWAVVAGFQLGVNGASDPGTVVNFSTYGNYNSPVVPESAEVKFSTTIAGNSLSVAPNSVSSYVGNGSFNVSLFTVISTQIQPLPATAAGFTWQLISRTIAAGIAMADTDTVSVSYNYTPSAAPATPEPSSLALMGVALGAGAAYRRFKTLGRV